MKLKDMLFFSGNLVHKSGENISNNHRFSLVGMYHDIDYLDFKPYSIEFKYKEKSKKPFNSFNLD